MRSCWFCGRTDNLERQIGGFWFCFWDLQPALNRGAAYWMRLYRALYPWRFDLHERI